MAPRSHLMIYTLDQRPGQAKSSQVNENNTKCDAGRTINLLLNSSNNLLLLIHSHREGRITIIVLLFLTRSWVSHGEWSSRTRRPSVNLILKVPWAHDKMIRGIILCSDFCYTANKSIVTVGQLPITYYSLLFAYCDRSRRGFVRVTLIVTLWGRWYAGILYIVGNITWPK